MKPVSGTGNRMTNSKGIFKNNCDYITVTTIPPYIFFIKRAYTQSITRLFHSIKIEC